MMDLNVFLNDYMERMGNTLGDSPFDKLAEAAAILMEARREGRWIFVAGNGGSSATASHLTNDFVKGLSSGNKKRFRVIALNDCVPLVTALSNDYSYEECFREQLKNYASPGDVLLVISGSGNSKNIVNAASYAKAAGMSVIAFTGRDGGKVGAYCDINCISAADVMEEIEDTHMVWEHSLICGLRQMIAEEK
jgi:D-sedoheptulose 7-phosphate isomerase